jgi:hypothetical protein
MVIIQLALCHRLNVSMQLAQHLTGSVPPILSLVECFQLMEVRGPGLAVKWALLGGNPTHISSISHPPKPATTQQHHDEDG